MKRLLRSLFDGVTLPLCRIGAVRSVITLLAYQSKRIRRRNAEARLRAAGLYGDVVQRGPFTGMKYLPEARYASCRFEKIVGSYEHELFELLNRLAKTKQYTTILNVGAAEGFYTCGMAMLFPQARILSYESTEVGREYARDLCKLNGVSDRVSINGTCELNEFIALEPQGSTLVLMDIDLGERLLLDPERVPWLKRCDILVELHDCLQAGTNDLVRSRCERSHSIEQITTAGLRYGDYPLLRDLLFEDIYALVGEDRRGLQDWFYMEPKA